jgi:hypothetical protein
MLSICPVIGAGEFGWSVVAIGEGSCYAEAEVES